MIAIIPGVQICIWTTNDKTFRSNIIGIAVKLGSGDE